MRSHRGENAPWASPGGNRISGVVDQEEGFATGPKLAPSDIEHMAGFLNVVKKLGFCVCTASVSTALRSCRL